MAHNDAPAGKGQCDIRLQVDNEVEVAVRGDMVFLRTLVGREARDDGSECNFPLPSQEMRGLGFEIRDGRNEIRIVERPSRRNNFAAVVHIRDTDGGYGRYCFRLTWDLGGEPVAPGPTDEVSPRRPEGFVWTNVVHYGGRGTGSAVYNDADLRRLVDVTLDIDRGGRATVSFHTEHGAPVDFNGLVMGREGDRLKIDATTQDHRLRGSMWVTVNPVMDTVRSIEMDGTDGRDRIRLHWDRQDERR